MRCCIVKFFLFTYYSCLILFLHHHLPILISQVTQNSFVAKKGSGSIEASSEDFQADAQYRNPQVTQHLNRIYAVNTAAEGAAGSRVVRPVSAPRIPYNRVSQNYRPRRPPGAGICLSPMKCIRTAFFFFSQHV